MEEIKRLQKEKGYGDPSFPRIPSCIPHDYYMQRLGRLQPFNVYKESLDLKKKESCRRKKETLEEWNINTDIPDELLGDSFMPDEGADDVRFSIGVEGDDNIEEEEEEEEIVTYNAVESEKEEVVEQEPDKLSSGTIKTNKNRMASSKEKKKKRKQKDAKEQ